MKNIYQFMVAGLGLFLLITCSGSSSSSNLVNPSPPAQKAEFVVVTSFVRENPVGTDITEDFLYHEDLRLMQVELPLFTGTPMRSVSPLRFTYDGDRLPIEVTGGFTSFNDMVQPTDFSLDWKQAFQLENGRVVFMDRTVTSTLTVLLEEPQVTQSHERIELEWDGNLPVRQTTRNEDGELLSRIEWFYPQDGSVIASRVITNSPEFTDVATYISDADGKLIKIEYERPMAKQGIVNRTFLFEYDNGMGTQTVNSTFLRNDGSTGENTFQVQFTYLLEEEPGFFSVVLDPLKGLSLMSPYYFRLGTSTSTASQFGAF